MGTTVTITISGALATDETEELAADLRQAVEGSEWRARAETPPGALDGGTMHAVLSSVFDGTVGVAVNAAIVGVVHQVMERWRGHHVVPDDHTYTVRIGDQVIVQDGVVVGVVPPEARVYRVGAQDGEPGTYDGGEGWTEG